MNVYVESSALLAVLLRESESEKTAILLEQSTVRVASMLTFLECRRAISKLVAGQIISEAIGREVVGELRQFEAACDVMEITSDAAKRAGEQFSKEPVRTLDAIHLATAL